jgi:hypothetical protein
VSDQTHGGHFFISTQAVGAVPRWELISHPNSGCVFLRQPHCVLSPPRTDGWVILSHSSPEGIKIPGGLDGALFLICSCPGLHMGRAGMLSQSRNPLALSPVRQGGAYGYRGKYLRGWLGDRQGLPACVVPLCPSYLCGAVTAHSAHGHNPCRTQHWALILCFAV